MDSSAPNWARLKMVGRFTTAKAEPPEPPMEASAGD
jgi:hypothetical protein